jgi:hypothetical protein
MTSTARIAHRSIISVFAFSACLVLVGQTQAGVIIDDFDTGLFSGTVSSPATSGSFTQTGAGILGVERNVGVSAAYTGTPLQSGRTVTVEVAGGEFVHDPGSRTNTQITLTYNGVGSGGFGNTDLTAMAAVGLEIVVTSNGTAFPATITLNDGTNSDSSTQTFPVGSGVVFFPFADFSGVDLTSINSIVVTLGAPLVGTTGGTGLANDFTIDIIQTQLAPEPMSLGLGVIGAVSLFAAHRRIRGRKA